MTHTVNDYLRNRQEFYKHTYSRINTHLKNKKEHFETVCNKPNKFLEEKNKMFQSEVERENTQINDILNERGKNYGDFKDHANITQDLKDTIHLGRSWGKCSNSQKEALEMIMHKVGRIVNGDPEYLDSWIDIVGYTQLVVEQLERKYK